MSWSWSTCKWDLKNVLTIHVDDGIESFRDSLLWWTSQWQLTVIGVTSFLPRKWSWRFFYTPSRCTIHPSKEQNTSWFDCSNWRRRWWIQHPRAPCSTHLQEWSFQRRNILSMDSWGDNRELEVVTAPKSVLWSDSVGQKSLCRVVLLHNVDCSQ